MELAEPADERPTSSYTEQSADNEGEKGPDPSAAFGGEDFDIAQWKANRSDIFGDLPPTRLQRQAPPQWARSVKLRESCPHERPV